MPNLPISSAATLTGANTASGDLFPLLDVSAAAGSQGSKITRDELRIAMGITGGGVVATGSYTLTIPATGTAALLGTANSFTAGQTIAPSSAATCLTLTGGTVTTALPVLDMTQTYNNAAIAFPGIRFNATYTAAATGSRLLTLQADSATKCTIDSTGSYYGGIGGTEFSLIANTTEVARCVTTGFRLGTQPVCFGANHASNTFRLQRDGSDHVLAQIGSTNAQTSRLYGTYTDASNYRRLAISSTTGGTFSIAPEGAGTGASGNVLHISGLPTSNPGPGILWNNAGTPAIGT